MTTATATLYEWRCGNCPPDEKNPPPLFGLVTEGGGVYVHARVSRERSVNLLADIRPAPLVQHCPRCHTWRKLVSDATGIHEEAATAPAIAIACPCTEPR